MTLHEPQRATLTVNEVAHTLGIGPATAARLVRAGVIPCLRAGRRILISRAVVDQILQTSQWPGGGLSDGDDARLTAGEIGSAER